MRKSILAAAGALTLLATAAPATAAPAAAAQASRPSPTIIHALPGAQVFPESAAVDPVTGQFWVGSVKDGTIFTGRVGSTKPVTVFSAAGADGRTIATGLSYRNGRLAVAGRQTGQMFVYNARTGTLISKLSNGLPTTGTFINDVAWGVDGSAYFTDSVAPVLWRARPSGARSYTLERFLDFTGSAVRYVTAQGPEGINVNGVTASADGRYLVIAKRNENALFRVDLRSRAVARLSLPADALTAPDGIVLRGHTLYVVQNTPASVRVLNLARDLRSGKVTRTITDPSFAFATGAALHRGRILVVSSQFDTLGSPAAVSGTTPPKLPFGLTELPLPTC